MKTVILSHFQVEKLLRARAAGEGTATISLDLGITSVEVGVAPGQVSFPDGQELSWEQIESIHAAENSCFVVLQGELNKVQYFSEETNRLYSLMPTSKAPTMLVSGIPMHRIKGTDPMRDTQEKIRAIKPVVGMVLDTATGLGYTAIRAAETADHVATIELDPVALEVARENPWSQGLFDNPKITQLIGDSYDCVAEMETEQFDRIIHDPPAFSLAGDLYSETFYQQLYRVLRPGGRLFHYIGDPKSKSGRNITAGVVARLQGSGFGTVKRAPRAFGVVAIKSRMQEHGSEWS
jgi:predicted methyltransferase